MRNRCKVTKITYKVNEEKKTVACILEYDLQVNKTHVPYWMLHDAKVPGYCDTGTVVGVAKCHPDDTFDIVRGKRIAESKAKALMYHKGYMLWRIIEKYLTKTWMKDIKQRRKACREAYLDELSHIDALGK